MAEKTAPATTAAETAETPRRRRGAPLAKENGRVTATLGPDLYSVLDEARWAERKESVGDLLASIAREWAASRGLV